MSTKIAGVAIRSTHVEVEHAAHELHRYGSLFEEMSQSCGGKGHRSEVHAGNRNSGIRSNYRDKQSTIGNRAWVLLVALAVFLFPMLSTLYLGGPVAAMIVTVWEIAVALVVLLMMGARLGRVVREDQ